MKKFLIIELMFVCSNLSGQALRSSDSLSTVSVVTEPSGSDVYIDSMYVGKSPIEHFGVAPGAHTIRAFYPSVFAWNAVSTEQRFETTGTENQVKRLTMGEVLRIHSNPPESMVRIGNTELGMTPLYARIPSPHAGDLVVQKDGYDSLKIALNDSGSGFLRLQLVPASGSRPLGSAGDILGTNGVISSDHALAYTSSAAMIVTGVASAYMKDRANRSYDSYLQTNNPSDLTTTRRLDRGALAALIVSQVSFAVLAYLLLSE